MNAGFHLVSGRRQRYARTLERAEAPVTTTIRLRFDCNSTALRPFHDIRYDRRQCDLNNLCGQPPQYDPAHCKLTFDLLTLKVVSESRVTWPTSLPILVFLGLSLERPRNRSRIVVVIAA